MNRKRRINKIFINKYKEITLKEIDKFTFAFLP
jgi:hypothetical protein